MAENMFTNLMGRQWKIRPVSQTLITLALARIDAAYRARHEPLDPPTYKLVAAGGAVQTFAHDETTLESEEAKAAWAKYKDATARLEAEKAAKRNRLWFMGGFDFALPEDGWAEEQAEIYGIEVPADPVERRWHYIQTVVLQCPEDIMQALQAITELSFAGVKTKEEVAAMVDSFRSSLQGQTAEPNQGEAGRLGTQPAPGRDTHGEGLAHDAEPVQKSRRRR